MKYLRNHYKVPAKRGRRVSYEIVKGVTFFGVITRAATFGPYMFVRNLGDGSRTLHHPQAVIYYDDDGSILWQPDDA